MTNNDGDTLPHVASHGDHTDVTKVMHESVTQTQWIHLLQMKGWEQMTILQMAVYSYKQSSIETIRDSVSDEKWIQLVSTPLPEYNQMIHMKNIYQQAVSRIDELRAAARVKSALQTENNSGV